MKSAKFKWLLISFFLLWTCVGYGIYWWYEISLDRQAIEYLPYEGPLLDKVHELFSGSKGDRIEAVQMLEEMPEYHRARILVELSKDEDVALRNVAITQMLPLLETPLIRARLAYLAAKDEDPKNRVAAKKVLSDEKP